MQSCRTLIPTSETLPQHNQPGSTSIGYRVNSLNKTATNISCLLENNSNTDQPQKNLAARKIQLFFRKFLAAKAYKHMFDNGEYFKQYKEISSEPKALIDYLTIAQKLSDKSINEIKNYLGELSDQEQAFVQRIINLPYFTLRHQTSYDLDHLNSAQKPTLAIKSNRCLNKSGVLCKGLTKEEDIKALSNNDFVFCSVNFAGADLAIKPQYSQIGDNTDYGYKAYLTYHKNKTLGYFTLTDHYYNKIINSYIRCCFCKSYPGLKKAIYKKIHGSLGENDVPIFTEQDMRLGIAYHAINIIRKTACNKLDKFIYQDSSLAELNEFLNVIFTPEFHIPRIFSTTDFKLHQLRKITTQEFYKLVIFYKQPDMIRQHYLGKYSTKDELININTQEDMDVISKACSGIIDIMDEAIQDANAEVLSFGIYWCEKIKNIGCPTGRLNFLNEHKACLSILQHNIEKIPEYASTFGSNFTMLIHFRDILLRTEDFNDEIYLYLSNIYDNAKNKVELVNLYTMINQIEDIPDHIIKSISYDTIATEFISGELFNLISKSFNLYYAKLIAKLIMQNTYDLDKFSERLNLYVYRYLPESISKISEDSFLGVLCNPSITQEARNTLQKAFIDSGILNPDKKINTSTDRTLRDYVKEHYNMDL